MLVKLKICDPKYVNFSAISGVSAPFLERLPLSKFLDATGFSVTFEQPVILTFKFQTLDEGAIFTYFNVLDLGGYGTRGTRTHGLSIMKLATVLRPVGDKIIFNAASDVIDDDL
jgi:hypothetical protein